MAKDNHLAVLTADGSDDRTASRIVRPCPTRPTSRWRSTGWSRSNPSPPPAGGAARIGTIMLDNFALDDLRAGVALIAGRATVEASGGVSLDTVSEIAATGRRRDLRRSPDAFRPCPRSGPGRPRREQRRRCLTREEAMFYLDHAATTPVRPDVVQAMLPYLGDRFGNPSSHHTVGEAAASVLSDAATARVAAVFGMRPADIVFTSGGTEADNLAAGHHDRHGAASRRRPKRLRCT